jgi:NAD(P)-dependent dehydrogenase (short-subunit alcohol dehydrogenase family)
VTDSEPKTLAGKVALITGGGSGIGRAIAHRLAAEGACVVVADRDTEAAATVAAELGTTDVAVPVTVDVTNEAQIADAVAAAALAFGGVDLVVNNAGLSISKPLLETTVADWDVQHDVMARGSFLVAREAARAMQAQGMGGDIVNPDGVVRGSGIFAGGWGAQRAAVYGVEEEDLGKFYAQRTLLKQEVLPEHVANAVFALTGGDLSHTTGLHIPVDAGVAAAFLR